MSGHIEIPGERDWHDILTDLSTRLRDSFGFSHVTLQLEASDTPIQLLPIPSLDPSADGRAPILAG